MTHLRWVGIVLIAVTALSSWTGCALQHDSRAPVARPPAAGQVSASRYIAYSLGEAHERLARGEPTSAELTTLGGLNLIAGGVYDQARRDVILVGQRVAQQPGATLDDLVVALRTVVAQHTVPLVSIDPTEETPSTGRQAVRFQGALPDTQYGLDFLMADIVLKEKLTLGLEPLHRRDLKAYLQLAAEHRANRLADDGLIVGTRLWFNLSTETTLVERPDAAVFAIASLPIIVEKEVMWVRLGDQPVEDPASIGDPAADASAQILSEHINELCDQYPTLARLRVLFSLAAVARGIGAIVPGAELRYWMEDYPIRQVETPKHYQLRVQRAEYADRQGRPSFVEVSGGIELKAILLRLQAGEVTALRDVVLQSRPSGGSLTWPVPIDEWQIPWASAFLPRAASPGTQGRSASPPSGAFFSTRSGLQDAPAPESERRYYAPPPPFRPEPLKVISVPDLGSGKASDLPRLPRPSDTPTPSPPSSPLPSTTLPPSSPLPSTTLPPSSPLPSTTLPPSSPLPSTTLPPSYSPPSYSPPRYSPPSYSPPPRYSPPGRW